MRPIGRPRVIKSDWSRAGWKPMSIEDFRITEEGQIVSAHALTEHLHFRVLDGDRLDPSYPIMFHLCTDNPSCIEFGYIDNLSGELRRLTAIGEKLP
jgi:hypothetical protein